MLKRRIPLILNEEQIQKLIAIQSSPMKPRTSIVRAGILLRYSRGEKIGAIASSLRRSKRRISYLISNTLQNLSLQGVPHLPNSSAIDAMRTGSILRRPW